LNNPLEVDRVADFMQIPSPQRSEWQRQLLISLGTNGHDADFAQLHLTAQALHSEIAITDVQTHRIHRILPNLSASLLQAPAPVIRIAHRRHNTLFAYDEQFRPIAPLHGHYWAIVTLRRRSGRIRSRAPLQLSDFMPVRLPRVTRHRSREMHEGHGPDLSPSPAISEEQPLDAEAHPLPRDSHQDDALMMPDLAAPPLSSMEGRDDMTNIDLQLAQNLLQQVELPPICVHWDQGYHFLLHQFQPDYLFRDRIRTFRYIPSDAKPLFRQCYTAVLTLLDNLPDPEHSTTANFLYKRVLSFLTTLPALLVSQVPGLGPNGILDKSRHIDTVS
jgi:hypothetical protein